MATQAIIDSPSVKHCEITLNLTDTKRKGSICSFFSPKRKVTEIEKQLSKEDGGDEVAGERKDEDEVEGERKEEDEVVGEREGQQKFDEIKAHGDQGQEEVGERHSSEEMEAGEHHQDEEAESEKDEVQGSDSERERRGPDPSPTISSWSSWYGNCCCIVY